MSAPELYDVDVALREVGKARARRDELTRQQVSIADALAIHLDRHFSAEELETVGRALVIAAASVGALADKEIPGTILCNILAFGGARLILDGRSFDPTREAQP